VNIIEIIWYCKTLNHIASSSTYWVNINCYAWIQYNTTYTQNNDGWYQVTIAAEGNYTEESHKFADGGTGYYRNYHNTIWYCKTLNHIASISKAYQTAHCYAMIYYNTTYTQDNDGYQQALLIGTEGNYTVQDHYWSGEGTIYYRNYHNIKILF